MVSISARVSIAVCEITVLLFHVKCKRNAKNYLPALAMLASADSAASALFAA